MIVGFGADLVDIRRVEKTLAKYGQRFTHRVFTEEERKKSEQRRCPAASYAKRFAAKEAASKALGLGMTFGVRWRDLGVINTKTGQPVLHITGQAAKRFQDMIPPGFEGKIHLTLTDDFPYAQAFVILEAVPKEQSAHFT